MFRYLWDGWLQWEGINPYRYTPNDPALASFHELPVYERLNSASYYSVYPPLSQWVFALGGGFLEIDWRLSFYLIKGIFLTLEGAGLWLLAQMTTARNLLLYAWNPLVIIEVAGQAHTEAAMIPFLIAAVWAVRHDHGHLASLAVAGAGLVKLYPLVLGPFLLRRYGWKAVWPGALLAAGVTAPYAAPYVLPHVKESVDLYFQLFEFNAAPYYLVKEAFFEWTGQDWSKQIGPAFRQLFLLSLPVLYGLDAWKKWRFERCVFATLGLFVVLSTTVHPWYLLALLPLAVATPQPRWHWLWLGAMSMGTYLLYVDGPYWNWIWIGWGGALLLALAAHADGFLQWIQKRRAERKVDRLLPLLPATDDGASPLSVLDLGAGEGYVGAALARRANAEVALADVVDMNRTDLPHTVYDGETLPYADDTFDVCVLYYVLHHCACPERVLTEALRVTRYRVLIVESVYTSPTHRRLLRGLDIAANRLRSAGDMADQEMHLAFRRQADWERTIVACGGQVEYRDTVDSWIHPQGMWSVHPARRKRTGPEQNGQRTAHTRSGEASSASIHR